MEQAIDIKNETLEEMINDYFYEKDKTSNCLIRSAIRVNSIQETMKCFANSVLFCNSIINYLFRITLTDFSVYSWLSLGVSSVYAAYVTWGTVYSHNTLQHHLLTDDNHGGHSHGGHSHGNGTVKAALIADRLGHMGETISVALYFISISDKKSYGEPWLNFLIRFAILTSVGIPGYLMSHSDARNCQRGFEAKDSSAEKNPTAKVGESGAQTEALRETPAEEAARIRSYLLNSKKADRVTYSGVLGECFMGVLNNLFYYVPVINNIEYSITGSEHEKGFSFLEATSTSFGISLFLCVFSTLGTIFLHYILSLRSQDEEMTETLLAEVVKREEKQSGSILPPASSTSEGTSLLSEYNPFHLIPYKSKGQKFFYHCASVGDANAHITEAISILNLVATTVMSPGYALLGVTAGLFILGAFMIYSDNAKCRKSLELHRREEYLLEKLYPGAPELQTRRMFFACTG